MRCILEAAEDVRHALNVWAIVDDVRRVLSVLEVMLCILEAVEGELGLLKVLE